jgi:hypothetical protein
MMSKYNREVLDFDPFLGFKNLPFLGMENPEIFKDSGLYDFGIPVLISESRFDQHVGIAYSYEELLKLVSVDRITTSQQSPIIVKISSHPLRRKVRR